MTLGRAVLVGLMRRYLAALMDPFVSLLEVHKLMYFQQQAGERLRLHYTKGTYGPYAENLRHVLTRIEGHLILGYGDAEDRPDKPLEIVPRATTQAEAFLARHPETRARFQRVADLIEGFETSFGLELLSTVHWVATQEAATSADAAIAKTYAWSARKRMFQPRHIQLALQTLRERGWVVPTR